MIEDYGLEDLTGGGAADDDDDHSRRPSRPQHSVSARKTAWPVNTAERLLDQINNHV